MSLLEIAFIVLFIAIADVLFLLFCVGILGGYCENLARLKVAQECKDKGFFEHDGETYECISITKGPKVLAVPEAILEATKSTQRRDFFAREPEGFEFCCDQCAKDDGVPLTLFYVCKICGNKRCPCKADHKFICTNSNDLNQTGVMNPIYIGVDNHEK